MRDERVKPLPTHCDRHWDQPAVGLYSVATSAFEVTAWLCAPCRDARVVQAEVKRRNAMSRERLSLAERKALGE